MKLRSCFCCCLDTGQDESVLSLSNTEFECLGPVQDDPGDGNTDLGDGNTDLGDGNTDLGDGNTELGDGNTDLGDGNTELGDGNTEQVRQNDTFVEIGDGKTEIDYSDVLYMNSRDKFIDGDIPELCYTDIPDASELEYIPKSNYTYTYPVIMKMKRKGIKKKLDDQHLEANLDDEEFEKVFRLSRKEFYSKKRWMQIKLKKELELF